MTGCEIRVPQLEADQTVYKELCVDICDGLVASGKAGRPNPQVQ